jgi:succinate-semialdehyde dehydrogenase/glutarate-semialdehyde dehydrogenase
MTHSDATNDRLSTLESMLSKLPTGMRIGATVRDASDGATLPVENPATTQVLARVADATAEDALAAVDLSMATQDGWARTPARERSDILLRASQMLLDRADQFAVLMTAEMGKPVPEALGEVAYAAELLRWFSEQAAHISGTVGTTADGRTQMLVSRRPVGPCLLITPWNFPLAMGARKVGPAVAAGCTMVFKPAPQTPLTSLAFADLLTEAGLPHGVLSVLTTSRAEQIVDPMIDTAQLRKLSFTGSTEVGRLLIAATARTVMRTSMELGGNAPFIVFDDADLDVAVDAAMSAKMRNMGEACTAANRILVHASAAQDFTSALAARMEALHVGDGMDAGVDVGPLIDRPSLDKVEHLCRDALARGARIVGEGQVPDGGGYFCAPRVLTDVRPDSDIQRVEIFGPVAAVTTFVDEDEALRLANATEWGLVGYVMTESLHRALRVRDALEVGMVGINTGIVSNPAAPFGGIKQSGLGREAGAVGIDEYLEHQYAAIPIR